MANLYQTAPYKGRPEPDKIRELMARAESEHDWECLKPYPMLLAVWQGKHQKDVLPIARWVSHFRAPFLKPDYQTHVVRINEGTQKLPMVREASYSTGRAVYGHTLCKPNCGSHDYITGELISEPLPF